jgi:hypothetical protein
MAKSKLENLADSIMNLSPDDAQELQIIIKAKLMPEVERQRGLLAEQQAATPQQYGQPQRPPQQQQQRAPAATQRDVRMAGLLR